MAPLKDYDTRAKASLSKLAEDLAVLEVAVAGASKDTPLPWPLFEVFVRLAAAAEVCEGVVRDHASGEARVSDGTLAVVADTLRLVRDITTALVRIALVTATDVA